MMRSAVRISLALACFIGVLWPGVPASGMDEDPQETASDTDVDDPSGTRQSEVERESESEPAENGHEVEPAATAVPEAPPTPAAVPVIPPTPVVETPPAPAPETPPAPVSETPPVPASQTPPTPHRETPLMPESETLPTPAPETGLAPETEASSTPETATPPTASGAATPTAVNDRPEDAEAPPAGAGPSATEPTEPRVEADAPAGDDIPPIADEDGVLPGEPEDQPGLPVEPAAELPPGAAPATPGDATDDSPESAEIPQPDVQRTLYLLGTEVPPGAIDWLSWSASESFEGISTPTPILIVNGTSPGPTLCLTAAVHGDELNGVEMVRRIMYSLDPEKLNGAVIGAPIVNLHGFRRSSRYLPDRRDLNRYFPGSPTGSSASRIAYSFFHEVIVNCNALVDVHTGSFHRANLPQIRADLSKPEVVELTKGFGATVVLHSVGGRGTLRRAASDAGIPAVTLEAGEPMRLQPKEVAHGVKGIETLLDKLGMVNKVSLWGDPQPVYYEARWIRANSGGILFSSVNLGERIRKGEVLGSVTDPITNKRSEIRSPYDGRIIGRALNQVVMPGFAAFHVGIQTSEKQLRDEQQAAAATAEATESGQADAASPSTKAPGDSPAASSGPLSGEIEADEEAEDYMEEERPE